MGLGNLKILKTSSAIKHSHWVSIETDPELYRSSERLLEQSFKTTGRQLSRLFSILIRFYIKYFGSTDHQN